MESLIFIIFLPLVSDVQKASGAKPKTNETYLRPDFLHWFYSNDAGLLLLVKFNNLPIFSLLSKNSNFEPQKRSL